MVGEGEQFHSVNGISDWLRSNYYASKQIQRVKPCLSGCIRAGELSMVLILPSFVRGLVKTMIICSYSEVRSPQ